MRAGGITGECTQAGGRAHGQMHRCGQTRARTLREDEVALVRQRRVHELRRVALRAAARQDAGRTRTAGTRASERATARARERKRERGRLLKAWQCGQRCPPTRRRQDEGRGAEGGSGRWGAHLVLVRVVELGLDHANLARVCAHARTQTEDRKRRRHMTRAHSGTQKFSTAARGTHWHNWLRRL